MKGVSDVMDPSPMFKTVKYEVIPLPKSVGVTFYLYVLISPVPSTEKNNQ